MNRRTFLSASALSFSGLQKLLASVPASTTDLYGSLVPDPNGVLDLPSGFSYQILSRTGQTMSDGLKVPGQPDGMAAFPQKDGTVVLVRNHELTFEMLNRSPFHDPLTYPESLPREASYAPGSEGEPPQIGGTTTIHYSPKEKKVLREFLSLTGTDRNCAGGAMPWGSWITCEEPENLAEGRTKNHGWCFEVKADPNSGLQKAIPLKALGRFRHEAVALDPNSRVLYLTEDRPDGLLYRFLPDTPDDFTSGTLQAAKLAKPDTRNWNKTSEPDKSPQKVEWIDLDDIDSPLDDLRHRGAASGAAVFARSEGIIWSEDSLYICATSGGPKRQGQIFKLTPSSEASDTIELFLQPSESDLLTNGDNLCEGPSGHLVVCEDMIKEFAGTIPHVRGVTREGQIYTIARNALNRSEFAGSCWDEASQTLFVNIQNPGITLAITGPWS